MRARGESQAISVQRLDLPSGGGALKGLGETFSPNPFSGTATVSIPLPVTKVRALTPEPKLVYDSGSGNGVFGVGFSLSVPTIARRTDRGIPRYDDSDTFVLTDAGQLVPALDRDGDHWVPSRREVTRTGTRYLVERYRPRTESRFARIERWTEDGGGPTHWEVTTAENVVHVYGHGEDCRIADPDDPSRIFQWNLEESRDAKGNRVAYRYRRDDRAGLPDADADAGLPGFRAPVNLYPDRIYFGNLLADEDDRWAFQLVFDYGQHDLDDPRITPDRPGGAWIARSDPFSSYRAGFEIRTNRLCRAALLFHHLPELGPEPMLVRALHLTYGESNHLSLLRSATEIGYRIEGGEAEVKQAPPVDFSYTGFEPLCRPFDRLTVSGNDPPGLNDGGHYQPVDLWGEGIAGILYRDHTSVLYFGPLGGGRFAPPTSEPFPPRGDDQRPALLDIDGDGRLEVVVSSGPQAGYFAIDPDDRWTGFHPFRSWPSDLGGEGHEFADLDGDGRSDLLVDEGPEHRVHFSEGRHGFGPATRRRRPPGLSGARGGAGAERVEFADMFGDGLDHRVRITDGAVECWPNLGGGRFGEPVRFENPPRFGPDFDPAHLRLADIDGSGTTDVVYLRSDCLEIHLNRSGTRFAPPLRIEWPERLDNLDDVYFADIMGTGTSCAVVTFDGPERHHLVYDFAGGTKPNLLVEVDNNRGGANRIEYRSSTAYYLDDKRAGRPWATRLPFPVQVVAATETIDRIVGTKQISRFAYRDGYYDGAEREFRGFGRVDRWDTEAFDQHRAADGLDRPFQLDDGLRAEPVHTRTWYHTGAPSRPADEAEREREFHHGDEGASPVRAVEVDRSLDPLDELDAVALRAASRALHGSVLREEVYGRDRDADPDAASTAPADGTEPAAHPYTVVEHGMVLRRIQPEADGRPGVYHAHVGETVNSTYERDPTDPRVEHVLNLDVDDFGAVILDCRVAYPRRGTPVGNGHEPDQSRFLMTCTRRQVINETVRFHLLGAAAEEWSYEIGGVRPNGPRFDRQALRTRLIEALVDPVPHGERLTGDRPRARLLGRTRTRYWDRDLRRALEPGQIADHALVHHTETAVVPDGGIDEIFAPRVDPDTVRSLLRSTGDTGLGHVLDDDLWWNPGDTAHYGGPVVFHRQEATVDPFGARWRTDWDRHGLAAARTVDPLGNVETATIDYRTLQPCRVTDPNGTTTEVAFDPLGRVRARTIHGTEGGRPRGDGPIADHVPQPDPGLDGLVADPHRYLQGATTYHVDDLLAWYDRRAPIVTVTVERLQHQSDLGPGVDPEIEITVDTLDGSGRSVQKASSVEPGPAWEHPVDGPARRVEAGERWLISDREVRNGNGDTVRRYEPFHATGPTWVDERAIAAHGVATVQHHDALHRLVRTDLPKGFLSRVSYGPWSIRHADPNDTIEESPYLVRHDGVLPPDEQDGLDKARAHSGTWRDEILDVLGRPFLDIELADRQGTGLVTRTVLDIEGRPLTVTDPRLEASGQGPNVERVYSLTGEVLREVGVDSGTRWTMVDAAGRTPHVWDDRGHHIVTAHDALSRPTRIEVTGDTTDRVVERMVYGDDLPDGAAYNLRGQLVTHLEQAGRLDIDHYDLHGEPSRIRRVLRVDHRGEPDWRVDGVEGLEAEEFVVEQRHDAKGRLVEKVLPDGTVCRWSYRPSGPVDRIELQADGVTETYVESATYNASGQREAIVYGNGVTSRQSFDEHTTLLRSIRTERSADGRLLQDLAYARDPVGNITRIQDHTFDRVFAGNTVVDAQRDHTYDALYRLTRATGREHVGLRTDRSPRSDLVGAGGPVASLHDRQAQRPYTRIYRYDAGGNLTAMRHTGASSFTRTIDIAATSNRGIEHQRRQRPGYGPEADHDAGGNPTRMAHLPSIRWDHRGNITEIVLVPRADDPADRQHHAYDADERRVRKVEERLGAGGRIQLTERIAIDDDYVVTRTRTEGGRINRESREVHVLDGDDRVAIVTRVTTGARRGEPARTVAYQLADHLGSAVLELNEVGEILTYEEYFPYGGTAFVAGRSEREVSRKEYRHSGRERDNSTGLYFYGARYYAPWLGRWLSPDPAGTVDGLNLYAFVGGNPVNRVDVGGRNGDDPPADRRHHSRRSRSPGTHGGGGRHSRSRVAHTGAPDRHHPYRGSAPSGPGAGPSPPQRGRVSAGIRSRAPMATGIAVGAIVGAAIGTLAGPVGVPFGALIGAYLGGLTAAGVKSQRGAKQPPEGPSFRRGVKKDIIPRTLIAGAALTGIVLATTSGWPVVVAGVAAALLTVIAGLAGAGLAGLFFGDRTSATGVARSWGRRFLSAANDKLFERLFVGLAAIAALGLLATALTPFGVAAVGVLILGAGGLIGRVVHKLTETPESRRQRGAVA